MSYNLLESPDRDDSNKWTNIGFGEDIKQVESIEDQSRVMFGALGKAWPIRVALHCQPKTLLCVVIFHCVNFHQIMNVASWSVLYLALI